MVDNRVEGLARQLLRFGKANSLADLPRQFLRQIALQGAVRPQYFTTHRQHSRQLDQRILFVIRHAQHALARHQRQGVALAGWPRQQALGAALRLLAVLLAQRLQLRTARGPLLQRLQRFFQQRFQLGVQRTLRILAGEGHANRVLRTAGEQTVQIQRTAGFRTGTGQPFAAERLHADHRANHIAVDVQVAHLGAAGDLGDGFVDTGMHAEGQAVARGVNLLDQFVQLVTVIAHHVQYRAEDLFFQLVEAVELDKRRRHEGPVTPFAGVFAILAHRLVDGAAFGAHRLNMAFDILFRFRIDNRTDIGGQAPRIAHPALAHGAAQHG